MSLDALNRSCACISVDRTALTSALEHDATLVGLSAELSSTRPHLFAELPVFVARPHIDAMRAIVEAITRVARLPGYREAVLTHAPDIARHDAGALGVFEGYDFHLGPDGPRLIEANTNAGGAMLNVALARAQRSCCVALDSLESVPKALDGFEDRVFAMFAREWKLAGRDGTFRHVAIVDDTPTEQYLHPEFRLFAAAFEARGVHATICDPRALRLVDGRLFADGDPSPIDLVYDRLTDFSFDEPSSAVLRAAYLGDRVVVTPHPRAHALVADKRNLTLLSDASKLRALGVDEATIATLVAGIPATRLVARADAEALWATRKTLFFKPTRGHASKGAYRGDKLTKRVFEEILDGDYVAQALVPPSDRVAVVDAESRAFKVDVRHYVYDGATELVVARLYQGQTTNFRTAGGGFATVFTTPD